MALQIMIIGLGNFGMTLAKNLAEKGAEVLAVDIDKDLVDEVSEYVTEAVCMDASDEGELEKLRPKERDAVVCAIGAESRESSILCTALLRQMGAPMIAARVHDKIHERILKLVGAHLVFNPEEEYGKRFANKILYHNLITDSYLGNDIQLTEIRIQPFMVGKTLVQLALPNKFGIIVAALRRGDPPKILRPDPNEPLQAEDRLLLVCGENAIARLMKES